jgi:FOG: PKD repeat
MSIALISIILLSTTALAASTAKTTKAPVAAFTASPTSGNVPLSVKFTDKSTGSPTEWKWNFGDGSEIIDGNTSAYQNPTHVYSKAGTYTVKETAINTVGRNTVTKSNYIKVTTPPAPVAAFTASPTSGNVPLSVKFTDKSTGSPTEWKWNFGDGSEIIDGNTSAYQNPTHVYSKAGTYTVKETAINTVGRNTVVKSNYIKVK